MTDSRARIKYMAEQQALKNSMTPAQIRAASAPNPDAGWGPWEPAGMGYEKRSHPTQGMQTRKIQAATPAPSVDFETLIRQKLENNTLAINDVLAARNAGMDSLATAIQRRLAGFPWEYTWTTTPATPTTPAMNPQVMWYDSGVWASNPTLAQLNNAQVAGQQTNPFSGLGKFSSYDPATGTTLQAPEKMNAFTMKQIDQDPVRKDFTESVYDRHNRSWDKEYADAIRMAPMGSATSYVRSG